MAKDRFSVDEDNYSFSNNDYNQSYNDFNGINNNQNEENIQTTQKNTNWYNVDYSENTDFSTIGLQEQSDFIDNSSIVFEEKQNETSEDRIKYKISTINKKVVAIIIALIMILVVALIAIVATISKERASYISEIIMPEIIYLGETSNISVVAKGKKDLDSTTTTFKSSNEMVATVLDSNLKGKNVLNTIIPIQEGSFEVEVISNVANKKTTKVKKTIEVCPAFTSDLINSKTISLVKESTYDLKIDFGGEKCGKDIFYESSNEQVMTVTANGEVKGINIGQAILTVRKGTRSFSVPVYVTEKFINMTYMGTTTDKIQMIPGQNTRIKLNYLPLNATTQSLDYYSDSESVASISKSGLITAHKEGTAVIMISTANRTQSLSITVIVSKGISQEGTIVTNVNLSKSEITLIEGGSEKITATVSPDNAKDKTITWKSSDPKVATVNKSGVIYGKSSGTALITATTSNGISKNVQVTVTTIKTPTITPSDGIASNKWHTRGYTLKLSGSESGVTYYYGTSSSTINTKGSDIKIIKDENKTYYVKACKENVCSEAAQYISKLDVTKPKVVTVAGIESTTVTEDTVQIAIQDITSLVNKWCVTTTNNSSNCKWQNITSTANPVIAYTAKTNGTYYVFATDNAGNVSEGLSFEITNIG